MPRQIILAPEAVLDIHDAYHWYEEQDRGLGDEFLRCLESAFGLIFKNPVNILSVSTNSGAF